MYDVIIIGGGPAGMSAALYASRGGLKVALIEKMSMGGQACLTSEIENYPGFINVGGFELSMKMNEQISALKVDIIYDTVSSLVLEGERKSVDTEFNGIIEAEAVILAMGARPRLLGVEGEERLTGSGISYCATCDAAFYRGKTVMVVGGGNTAVEDALYLEKFAKKVMLLHRRNQFRAGPTLAERIKNSNVELILESVVTQLIGEQNLKGVVVKDVNTGVEREIELDGLFVAVGQQPQTDMVKDLAPNGYIITNDKMETSIPMVYAVGDIRVKPLRQVVTAAADGAIAGEMLVRKSLKYE
ncbi:MAG: thioredoxin-disulfide reductase [Clostridia bacterium]|nr:thioredoxin-disulfide reductase [Clostridia bacterium]